MPDVEIPVAEPAATDATGIVDPGPPPPVRRRRTRWPVAVAVVVVVAVAAWLAWPSGDAVGETADAAPPATAEVVVTDLTAVTTYSGTLGRVAGDPVNALVEGTLTAVAEPGDVVDEGGVLFAVDGEPVVLLNGDEPFHRTIATSEGVTSVTGRGTGTITWVPDVGDLIAEGETLYSVDEIPVVMLHGDVPMWRELSNSGDDGPDVAQLEQALVDLGYDPDGTVTVDEEFTGYTEAMVERWQEDLGLEEDGVVDLGEIVFLPGDVEVRSITTAAGQSLGEGIAVLEVGNGISPSGPDVEQLEAALERLGFTAGGDLVVDGVHDNATRRAVVAWQKSIGATPDGIVDPAEVVVASGSLRIAEQLVTAGSTVAPGTGVLAVTGSDIVVTVQLPAGDQEVVEVGDAVGVELPDGTDVPATVVAVAGVATIGDDDSAVFEVTVTLDDAGAASGLDEAPVDVDVVTDSVEGALAVPVTALVALAEGGYAVEAVDGGTTRLVAVDPGFYADGMVEITASDLAAGTLVVVP